MARDTIVDALDRCVEEIQAGTATVEECLARYPQLRAELEPLLSIAGGISTFSVVPDPTQKAAARASFVAALDATPSLELVTMPVGGVTALPTMTAIADILDACLDDILAGRATADECLNRYPALRGELEPLLAVSSRLIRSDLAPDPARKLAARARFIEALYAEPEYRGLRGWVAAFLDQAASFRVGLRGAVSMGLALVLATSSGAVYASEQALPGAPLYGVKLAVEQVRVVTAFDEESKAQVELDIASRRLTEVERALELGDQVAVQAAATSYAATIQQADERLERIGERSQDVSARLESHLNHQQIVLATAVAQAPTDSKGSLEQARGQAQRGIERSANRSSGGAGAAAPLSTTTSGASGASRATPRVNTTPTHTPLPKSSPEPTAQRDAIPEPTDARRNEVPTRVIRQVTPAPISGPEFTAPREATTEATETRRDEVMTPVIRLVTAVPTSGPEFTVPREATPEPTETRRNQIATAVLRQVTAAPTFESRRQPTVGVPAPNSDDKDDNDRGAGQDGDRGHGATTAIPAGPTVPPVPAVQQPTPATVPTVEQPTAATAPPPRTVVVPTQAAARTTVPVPQVAPSRISGTNSGSSTSSNGQTKNERNTVVAGASTSQPVAGSAATNFFKRIQNGNGKTQS